MEGWGLLCTWKSLGGCAVAVQLLSPVEDAVSLQRRAAGSCPLWFASLWLRDAERQRCQGTLRAPSAPVPHRISLLEDKPVIS